MAFTLTTSLQLSPAVRVEIVTTGETMLQCMEAVSAELAAAVSMDAIDTDVMLAALEERGDIDQWANDDQGNSIADPQSLI